MSDLVQLPEGGSRESRVAGLAGALFRGFFDLAGSTVRCLERNPKSIEIYGWLVLAGLITFIGWFPAVIWLSSHDSEWRDVSRYQFVIEMLIAYVSIIFVLIVFPLYTLATALLVHPLVRYAFGGGSGLRATVVATSWAAMLIALASAAAGIGCFLLFAVSMDQASGSYSDLYIVAFNLCAFLWIWSKCLAGAHRFQRHYGLFAALATLESAFFILILF